MSPRDVDLMLLDPDTGVTALSASAVIGAAVDTEGGFFALVRIKFGTIEAGTSPTLDITIEASLDDETTWFHIGAFPQLDNLDDDIEIARPVWIPLADVKATTPVYHVAVRIYGTITGTADYDISWAYIEPLLALACPAGDEAAAAADRRGVEALALWEGA